MLSSWTIVALFMLFASLHRSVLFLVNVRKVREIGLPYTFSLINEFEIWAYITDPILRWQFAVYLMKGNGWPRWARFMVKGWMYEDKGRAHDEFGEVFLVVSPGGIICYVANSSTANNVCTRRKDFSKPPLKMKMLEPFGPNIVSTDGDLWRLHSRITATPLGEEMNLLVWSETIRQTKLLRTPWSSKNSNWLKMDIYTLALNVMSYAGFGQQAEWAIDDNAITKGHELALVSSIYEVVNYLPHILLMPKWLLALSPWQIAYQAYVELDRYLKEYLAAEKAALLDGSDVERSTKGNFLTAVLKSSMAKSNEKATTYGGRNYLTKDEITGNTFMLMLAGYDTTANTIIISSINLALHPNLQDRIIQEIDHIYDEARKAGRHELSYSEDMPKFRYVLAFMVGLSSKVLYYGVMRVFPTVISIDRQITADQELYVGDKDRGLKHLLPAGCGVVMNITALHYNVKYWPQPEVLEPQRWLSSSPNTYDPTNPKQDADKETAEQHTIPGCQKGTFFTFSEGPRACVGRRFATTEFIAFFASLLREYRMQLAPDVSAEEVDRKIRLSSGGSPITLVPPEDVRLILVRRK